MKRLCAFFGILAIISLVFSCGMLLPSAPSISPYGKTVIANPQIRATLDIVISCAEGETIYYTIDGTEPTVDSPVYHGPITICKTTEVKAVAVSGFGIPSTVASAVYTFVRRSVYKYLDSTGTVTQTRVYSYDGQGFITRIDFYTGDTTNPASLSRYRLYTYVGDKVSTIGHYNATGNALMWLASFTWVSDTQYSTIECFSDLAMTAKLYKDDLTYDALGRMTADVYSLWDSGTNAYVLGASYQFSGFDSNDLFTAESETDYTGNPPVQSDAHSFDCVNVYDVNGACSSTTYSENSALSYEERFIYVTY